MATIRLNRSEIHYEYIADNPAAPSLVFLHEGLGCIEMWRDFPKRLCQETGCSGLLYDREGYGASSPQLTTRTDRYLHNYALQELPAVIDAVIPGIPYIIIGHSDGGSIGLIHAAQQPALLKGVVTIAAHVFVESETLAGVKKADKAFEEGKFAGLKRYHGEKSNVMFKSWSRTWLSSWFRNWNIIDLLPAITCPVLAIQGEADQYGTSQQVDTICAGVADGARACIIERCGHAPHSQKPQEVISAIVDFIGEIS